jgi:hypothetical protein
MYARILNELKMIPKELKSMLDYATIMFLFDNDTAMKRR